MIGFGGPKPKPEPLPMFVNNCSHSFQNKFMGDMLNSVDSLASSQATSIDYYYLFRISYLYYIVLGFLITVILSMLLSLLSRNATYQANEDLFTPLVAEYIRKRKRRDETVYMVSSSSSP